MATWNDKMHRTSKNKVQAHDREMHSNISVKPAPKS